MQASDVSSCCTFIILVGTYTCSSPQLKWNNSTGNMLLSCSCDASTVQKLGWHTSLQKFGWHPWHNLNFRLSVSLIITKKLWIIICVNFYFYFVHRYLYKNKISEIESRAFEGLAALEQLYLYSNDLQELQPGTFSNLPSLERL